MNQNISESRPGISADVPAGVPEPDQIASGRASAGQENTITGLPVDIVVSLCRREDRIQELLSQRIDLLNKRIDRLNRRLTAIEEERRRSE